MKVLFFLWGIVGFLFNLISLVSMLAPIGVGVGTSAYVAAGALIWIGGMIFFGLGSLITVPRDQDDGRIHVTKI